VAVKGKWAQGIEPRNFRWVVKDAFAVCERPGGYGANHRRVRRQEEIIWVREQGFSPVISIIPSPANLHNYDELGVTWQHRPFGNHDDVAQYLLSLYPELRNLLAKRHKVLVHGEELGDRISGIIAGYLIWADLIPNGPKAITFTERLLQRQLGPQGREMVTLALDLPKPTQA
jgi:hypothetical protein